MVILMIDLKMAFPKTFQINFQLLAIKLHYFLFWGGIGSSVIFVPLLAKSVGISASFVGILWMVIALTTLICQPGFGAISDRFQNSKVVVMVVVFITAVSLYLLLHIPPIEQKFIHQIFLNCKGKNVNVEPHSNYNATCLQLLFNQNEYCNYLLALDRDTDLFCNSNETAILNPNSSLFNNQSSHSDCSKYYLQGCKTDVIYRSSCDLQLLSCFVDKGERRVNIYSTYQLWSFSALMIISQTMMYTCFSLSDAMCYEVLGTEKKHDFGKQRLWSTVSYGVMSFVAGYFNDLASESQKITTYNIGFYIMLGATFLDLIVLYQIPRVQVKMAVFSCKNVGQVLVSFEIISFVIGVFFMGMMTALLWNYQFWFLESLGASQTLIGLTSLIQSLIADVIFFVISGKILKTLGHFNCLAFALLGFTVRFILYYMLKAPWHMLPVEILDGVTFSLFYVTMTGFAKVKAPIGMEATMVGLLVATYEGLGIALGSLLSGVGFDHLGGRYTFLVAGIASAVCAGLVLLLNLATKSKGSVPKEEVD